MFCTEIEPRFIIFCILCMTEQNTGAVDFENVLIRNLIYMWLRNTSMSERTQENELFTSYVPGLQDVGSYGNHASVSFFLHRLGENSYSSIRAGEMIEAAVTEGNWLKYKHWNPSSGVQVGTAEPRCAGKGLGSRAPTSHTQQPNLKDFGWGKADL